MDPSWTIRPWREGASARPCRGGASTRPGCGFARARPCRAGVALVGLVGAVVALAACSGPDREKPAVTVDRHAPSAPPTLPPLAAPGLRLPDAITPLHYTLTLDVDPDRDTFSGEVHIRVRLEHPADHFWIHADQLAITDARYDGGTLTQLPVQGDQMVAFGFGRTVAAGDHELSFIYTGKTTGDQEGLFRQRSGDRWYLFSQGESVFARRMTPCFDEPRFKTPWQLTLIVPRMQVALANTAEAKQELVAPDRKRVTFAETGAMASYLLTIAVGPFDLVDAGHVGAQKVPVRVAVHAGAGKQVGVVASRLPAVVAALEDYVGEPLPLTKLDLVAVPEFFGAMENPGLITFEQNIFVGKESKQRTAYFTHIAAHELAHQWFGNLVTPAWWDDLWLSESFASFIGDKVTRRLGAFDDRPLHDVLERRDAIEADLSPTAVPLRRPIEGNRDPDDAFDAIAYSKGETVLATFEALVGEDVLRTAVRDYVRAHRDRNATTDDLVAALSHATNADVGKAFQQYATLPGVPVVDLALRCGATATLVARAREHRLVPTCVRAAGSKTNVCALVGDQTELALGKSCPAWVDANPNAAYYSVHWTDRAPTQWLAQLPPVARVIIGDDLAAAFHRGELPAKDALVALATLLAGDLDAQLGGVALARQLDAVVDEATRPAWSAWLVRRIPKVDKKRRNPLALDVVRELDGMLVASDRASPAQLRQERELVDKQLSGDRVPDPDRLALVANDALFERVVDKARATQDKDRREQWLELLGAFPAAYAERTAALASDKTELPIEPIWRALATYFDRPAATAAAWHALRGHLDAFEKRMPDRVPELVDAAASLCDPGSRAEVASTLAGKPHLDRTLAAIDGCIARRGRVGDLAAAITTSR